MRSSGVRSGQPRVENAQSEDENQVSSTSGSCMNVRPPQRGQLSGWARATIGCARDRSTPPRRTVGDSSGRSVSSPWRGLHERQYQAGIWWPHQSWRLTHQSWMLRIQLKKVDVHVSGTNRVRPCSTAPTAFLASGSTFTNHWGDSRGSTTVAQRWQVPTESACGTSFSSRPRSARSSSTRIRASRRSSPT